MNPFEPDPSGDVTRLPVAESGGGATGDVAFTDTSGALSVESEVADGESAVAFSFGTSTEMVTATIMAVRNHETDLLLLDPNGYITAPSQSAGINIGDSGADIILQPSELRLRISGAAKTHLRPTVSDGASAVAYTFNTSSALANAGAKLASFQNNSAVMVAVGVAASAGETPLFLLDPDNATVQRVTLGAADSGGSGFRCLRIPNAP